MEKERAILLAEQILVGLHRIIESQGLLNRKFDRIENRLDEMQWNFGRKIENLLTDELAAYRADTEQHRGYLVAES